jgi:hypothetical protein
MENLRTGLALVRTKSVVTSGLEEEGFQLLGLDHPLVAAYLRRFREQPPEELGFPPPLS